MTFRIKIQKKIIGSAEAKNGLYYLGASNASLSAISIDPDHKFSLYLKTLGHLTFFTLNVMFLLLFENSDYGNLHNDVCKLVKHKNLHFPINKKRSMVSFSLIHNDV